jgi:DNA-binding response OmpR family regulator
MWVIPPLRFNVKVMNNFETTTTTHLANNAAASTVKTALVVDDEAALLPVYIQFLERMGFVATGVTNGADAIEQMEQQDYDLVLLDLRMPAKTGFEVLSEIRPNHPNTSIVMVSGCVRSEFADTALRLGADSYVAKPCSLGYLAERVQYAQELRASASNRINRRKSLTIAVA